jgi:Hsp20/alpha crystallin family
MPLPAAVNEADIKASYTDGVLEVRIPVPEQAENPSRKIPITRGAPSSAGTDTSAEPGGKAPVRQYLLNEENCWLRDPVGVPPVDLQPGNRRHQMFPRYP